MDVLQIADDTGRRAFGRYWSADTKRGCFLRSVRKAAITAAAACLVPAIGAAATGGGYPHVRFERLEVNDAPSRSGLRAIVQDQDGYLWFGHQFGLDRFDGHDFLSFRHDAADPGTLSSNVVQSMLLAKSGHIWVGTSDGLNRVDPVEKTVERIPLPETEGRQEGQPRVRSLFEDRSGRLYALTSAGVLRVAPDSLEVHRVLFPESAGSVRPDRSSALLDKAGRFWVANGQGLWRLEGQHQRFDRVRLAEDESYVQGRDLLAELPDGRIVWGTARGAYLIDPGAPGRAELLEPTRHGRASDRVSAVAATPDGSLWMLLERFLVRVDPDSGDWSVLLKRPPLIRRNGFRARLQVEVDRYGNQWLAGLFGVGLYESRNGTFQTFRHEPLNPDSLAPTTLSDGYRIFIDRDGVIWAGGGLGHISRFVPESVRFQLIRDTDSVDGFAVQNVVRSILEQPAGDAEYLWLGLDSSGLRRMERQPSGRYKRIATYRTDAPVSRRLPDNHVSALALDPENQNIWVGSRGGITLIDGQSGSVVRSFEVEPGGLRREVESLLFTDGGQKLWAGTSHGIAEYRFGSDRTNATLHRVHLINDFSKHDDRYRIFNMIPVSGGKMLVATQIGFTVFDPEEASGNHYLPGGDDKNHPRNNVFGLAEFPAGTYWLGTRNGGLVRVRMQQSGQGKPVPDYKFLDRKDGLADDTVYAILPDAHGYLWLSTNRGLTRFDPKTGESWHFGPADGLQDHEFNHAAAHRGASGRFYFGGIRGTNAFYPKDIQRHPNAPRVQLQQVSVNGQSVSLDGQKRIDLKLAYDENRLTIRYVGLHYLDPDRNDYAYRMEGLEESWVYVDEQRVARYPSLPPGRYAFTVRAANPDGVWSEPKVLLTATIDPPPWLSLPAYIVYAVALLGAVLLAIYLHFRRRRYLERQVAERTAQLAEQKEVVSRQAIDLENALQARTVLVANVSHEFRTPLTLIQATLDRLERDGANASTVEVGRRYIRRLLRLVDQLLELSRVRVNRARYQRPWALDDVVTMTVEAFQSLALDKGIQLDASVEPGWRTRCAQDQVEKILFNLISNALKYTPRDGRVRVELSGRDEFAELAVSDTGPGIPEADQEIIFKRFQRTQAAEQTNIHGVGIGLALVREIALSYDGEVAVESNPGEGSRFTVTLPAFRDDTDVEDASFRAQDRLTLELALLREQSQHPVLPPADPERDKETETVLVVEDNADLRNYLAEVLTPHWRVITAENGQAALDMARHHEPDMVVTDIMMPEMDGFELLKALRKDLLTSHLPVLLLTARQDEETRYRGLTLSADDFLPKPFDPAELRIRLQRMADNRRRLKAHLLSELGQAGAAEDFDDLEESTQEEALSERDRQFLERLEAWLDSRYSDPEVSVETMAGDMAMDRRTLQRKLRGLTGRTPGAYLQAYRLQCARRLLAETDRLISDIALSCGFASQQYFTRVFRRELGMPPGTWRKRHR